MSDIKVSRNRKIMEDVLNGKSFTDCSKEHDICVESVRAAFLREVRRTVPGIYDEGTDAKCNGAYATPSLRWLRTNKDRILSAPLLAEPVVFKGYGKARINNMIRTLENLGYVVTYRAVDK